MSEPNLRNRAGRPSGIQSPLSIARRNPNDWTSSRSTYSSNNCRRAGTEFQIVTPTSRAAAMIDQEPLGQAGRARRVYDVCKIIRQRASGLPIVLDRCRILLVNADDPNCIRQCERTEQPGLGQNNRYIAMVDQVRYALVRQ